jgi:hypothetical protein
LRVRVCERKGVRDERQGRARERQVLLLLLLL